MLQGRWIPQLIGKRVIVYFNRENLNSDRRTVVNFINLSGLRLQTVAEDK
jgi:hypothetical protein